MRSWILAACAFLAFSACSPPSVFAPGDAVASASFRYDGPNRLTLFTMVSNQTGYGSHSALMINGEERVIFDPAGTFSSDLAPEQHDVLFGITPQVAAQYTAYHTRADFDSHLLVQSIDISAEMANALLRAAKAHGEVPGGLCARSTSSLIASLPGFENIQQTWFPLKVSEQFGAISGVTTRRIN